MGIFRPDNQKRYERAVQLSTEAKTYWEEQHKDAQEIQQQGEQLIKKIAQIIELKKQDPKNVFQLPESNADWIIEGNLLPCSSSSMGLAKDTLTFINRVVGFVISSILITKSVQTARLTIRTLALANLTANIGARQAFIFSAEEVAAAISGMSKLSRTWIYVKSMGKATLISAAITGFVELGIQLIEDETTHDALVKSIRELAEKRLELQFMKDVHREVRAAFTAINIKAQLDLASLKKNPSKNYDIKEEIIDGLVDLLVENLEGIEKKCLDELKKKDTESYLKDDPDLTHHLQEVTKATRLKKIVVYSGDVVDSIQCITVGEKELNKWGGSGGEKHEIDIGNDEKINEISWTETKYNGSKAVCKLKIVTNINTYGPYGTGRATQTGWEKVVKTPTNQRVAYLIGQNEAKITTDGKLESNTTPYVEIIKVVGSLEK